MHIILSNMVLTAARFLMFVALVNRALKETFLLASCLLDFRLQSFLRQVLIYIMSSYIILLDITYEIAAK